MAAPKKRVKTLNPLPNPLLIASPLATGLVMSLGPIGVGALVIVTSSNGRGLAIGIALIIGGACFLYPTLWMLVRRLRHGADR